MNGLIVAVIKGWLFGIGYLVLGNGATCSIQQAVSPLCTSALQ